MQARQYPSLEVLSLSSSSAASWSCWRHWHWSAACGHSKSLLKVKRTKARQDKAASRADVFPILLFHTVFCKLGHSEVDWIPCCSFPSDPGDPPARQEHNCCTEASTKSPQESRSSSWKLNSEIQALSCSLNQLEMGHQDNLCCTLHFNLPQGGNLPWELRKME